MTEQRKSQFAEIEEEMLKKWESERTFEQSLKQREGQSYFSFYDGPPFANGLPHFGHSLVTSIKDSLGRYKTMRGYYVERRNGWDCHGLPVEFAIEKQLGISGKKQILDLGLDTFNAACRDSVFMYKSEWEDFFKRIGRWTEAERAYASIDREYTESVWWVLGEIHKKGLLYKGYKSMPYCPRCETPLSNFEVNEGYRDNVPDPSLYVKFKIQGEDVFLLGWTTTPWSLPGNAAIAVNPNEQYVYVRHKNVNDQEELLILAKKRLSVLDETDYSVVREVQGEELVGRSYEPLFRPENLDKLAGGENLYKIWPAGFVSVEDGSGVLHVAPAFGEDDLKLGQDHGLPVLSTVDTSGHMLPVKDVPGLEGCFFKDADRLIIEDLSKRNAVFSAETFQHTYPFCYRCESPLLYYAVSTWFVRISAIKEELLQTAGDIHWVPGHIKEGRFGKWLEGARDWAISRNRYWGAAMPIWVNEQDETDYIVISSTAELRELAGKDIDLDDLHRPFIDNVVIRKDGKIYRRIEEVLDCWFESGSMPVAQQHYPLDNVDKFTASFPADYIGEGLDQTRLWFYVLHVIGTILFNKPAYKNVLVNGMIMAADGQKLSKRLKNYPPVEDVFAREGADSLRLYLLSNHQAVAGEYMRFNRDAMRDLNRNVLGTLQNTFRFFKMYADIDKWQAPSVLAEPQSRHVLDRWLLSRLRETIQETTLQADGYKLAHAINPIFLLIDDLSNWYVRRSRRRFWKSGDDADKQQAYETLHYVLVRVCQLLAPWAPFLSDKLYRELVAGTDLPTSVHLTDWPDTQEADARLLYEMKVTRDFINEGLRQRAAANIKVRQPLRRAVIDGAIPVPDEMKAIMAEELNVKEVVFNRPPGITAQTSFSEVVQRPANVLPGDLKLDTEITEELKVEGVMRDLVRHIQNARKNAGLNVEDRIKLSVESQHELLKRALDDHADTVKSETLAIEIGPLDTPAYQETVKINGQEANIALSKA
jgi:isoleucyl-tRNA synthetase